MTNLSMLIKGFRGSIKTEIVKVYLVYCICYKIEPYIVIQSYDSGSSEDMVRNVARMLMNESIVKDYWMLFPFTSDKEDMKKRSVSNFDSTNWVRVVSKSLWEKLRWASNYDEEAWSDRPTLLVLDDIDVIDSVRNVEIINKNYQKITWETIWSLSKERSRIIFLGNVILTDGIVPRFASEKAASPFWKIYHQPLFDENGNTTWDFFTPSMIDQIRDAEWDAFEPNYLLIPSKLLGMTVFDMSRDYVVKPYYKEIEWFRLYQHPKWRLKIGIDMAEGWERGDFSTITALDDMAKVVFQFKWRLNETEFAKKIDFILTYEENGQRYMGALIPENNVGLALINECKKYEWFRHVVVEQKLNDSDDYSEWTIKKYGFRMSASSKDLIIREFKNWLETWAVDVTDWTYMEMTTFAYDKNNRPNAMPPYHDDVLVSHMIAYYWVLHINYIVEGEEVKPDYWSLPNAHAKLMWQLKYGDPPEDFIW